MRATDIQQVFLFLLFMAFVVGALCVGFYSYLSKSGIESYCTSNKVFMINGQFYQCVKVKAEVIK